VAAAWEAPAGVSAISFTSRAVSTSLSRDARVCNNIVVGPWNWRKSYITRSAWHFEGEAFGRVTLSPQIVRLDQVLKVRNSLLKFFQVSDCRMTLKNLVSGSILPKSIPGIWSRRAEDFKRYGSGGCCVIVYATTLLSLMSVGSPLDTTNAIPGMS